MSELDKFRPSESPVVRSVENPPVRRLSRGLVRYLRAALDRLDHLEYGDPSEFVSHVTGIETRPRPLVEVWVPPVFRQQEERGAEVGLDFVLSDKNNCIVVLAHPGHGKSTLARFLTCHYLKEYQEGRSGCYGLYVPLSELKLSKKHDEQAIIECALSFVGLDPSDSELVQDLESQIENAILVFDGLDELPINHSSEPTKEPRTLRRLAAGAILLSNANRHRSAPGAPSIRSIVTCRSADYFEDKESSLGSAPHYVLSGFGADQIPTAIKKWHDAAKHAGLEHSDISDVFSAEMDDRVIALQSVLRENSDLAEVCLTPLMLSILQTVYSSKGDLPSSVSQLCNRAVNWLLVEKHPQFAELSDRTWLGKIISLVGWEIHKRAIDGSQKSVTDDDLKRIANSTYSRSARSNTEKAARDVAIVNVVAHLRRGHGILVKVGDEKYDFAHNVFREVMAGRALGMEPLSGRRVYALDAAWHAPIRYWAGLRAIGNDVFLENSSKGVSQAGLFEINTFVGELEADCAAGNATAILACGEMLAEACSILDRLSFPRDLQGRIEVTRNRLVQVLSNSSLPFPQRLRVGDILSVLGDPRLEVPVLRRMFLVKGGHSEIGRASNHATRNSKYSRAPAMPVTRGELQPYSVATFLTTNAEYSAFIRDGGYRAREFWPGEIGWKWVSGDERTAERLIESARSSAPTHLSTEIQGQRIVEQDIPDRCQKMVARSAPLYWGDPALNRPNQPVVGVNWWEANAYCLWLTKQLKSRGEIGERDVIRLPTEAEWETAARLCGDGNVYPWKSGTPEENAHVRALDRNAQFAQRSCAVGAFPFVATNLNAYDMTGNAWEWTGSKVTPYSEQSFAQSYTTDDLDERIARGTSWLSQEPESAEITFRSFDPPFNAYEDLGFRIVVLRSNAN